MHKGFQETWETYRANVTSTVNIQSVPIIITGHSRGGALAVLAFRSIMREKCFPHSVSTKNIHCTDSKTFQSLFR